MLDQDEQEAFDRQLALTDYLASFTNPEAVKETQERRKRGAGYNDQEFAASVSKMFGRAPQFKPKEK